MTTFIPPSTVRTSMYFRPGDHERAFAIVFKPLEEFSQRGDREMRCQVTVFQAEGDLEAGKPTLVLPEAIVSSGAIFRQLAGALAAGGILAGYIGQGNLTGYGTRPWVIEDLEPDVQEKVASVWAEMGA